jgi:hypothetical protein
VDLLEEFENKNPTGPNIGRILKLHTCQRVYIIKTIHETPCEKKDMSAALWYFLHTYTSLFLSLNSVQSPRRKEKFVQKDSGERIKPLTLLKKTIQSSTTSLKLGM